MCVCVCVCVCVCACVWHPHNATATATPTAIAATTAATRATRASTTTTSTGVTHHSLSMNARFHRAHAPSQSSSPSGRSRLCRAADAIKPLLPFCELLGRSGDEAAWPLVVAPCVVATAWRTKSFEQVSWPFLYVVRSRHEVKQLAVINLSPTRKFM